MIKAAVMGYGTIGSGVAEVLEQNKDVIKQRAGQEIALKYVLDLREFPDSPVADKIIHDFKVIEEDEEIRIVVETMGGLNPAYSFVKSCLLAGKHVVTSNKALVAAHGTELLAIARQRHVNFLFEASVGGGIPIIRPLYRCLGGEQIEEIASSIQSVIDAENKRYIMADVPRDRLSDVERIIPGIGGPTILDIAGNSGFMAVHAVIDSGQTFHVIAELKKIGAKGILTTPIERLVN